MSCVSSRSVAVSSYKNYATGSCKTKLKYQVVKDNQCVKLFVDRGDKTYAEYFKVDIDPYKVYKKSVKRTTRTTVHTSSSLSAGAIAGIVIGCVCCYILLAVLWRFCFRKSDVIVIEKEGGAPIETTKQNTTEMEVLDNSNNMTVVSVTPDPVLQPKPMMMHPQQPMMAQPMQPVMQPNMAYA